MIDVSLNEAARSAQRHQDAVERDRYRRAAEQRLACEQAERAAEEQVMRKQDLAHYNDIEAAARSALVAKAGLDETAAARVVEQIVAGNIPSVILTISCYPQSMLHQGSKEDITPCRAASC